MYLLTGGLDGDTLRGTFHAGLRTQTPFVAVRSTGRPHLTLSTAVVRADTSGPFTFAFPSVDGGVMTSSDARFRGKVVIVDIFGTWCPTCHDAAPALVNLHRMYGDRGLEIVGLAYEVTGDTAVDGGLTFASLAAGPRFTCGTTTNATTYCWGANSAGQLGTGDTTAASSPVVVVGAHAFQRITAGGEHACGVDGSGAAWCWGSRGSRRLGDGYGDYAPLPLPVTGMPASARR